MWSRLAATGAVTSMLAAVLWMAAGTSTARPVRSDAAGTPATATAATAATTATTAAADEAAVTYADERNPDPRWRFFTRDHSWHTSPWFAGHHRVMVGFGCTRAPYYSPDPHCRHERGFHHGIDVAMVCGTRLFSAVRGRVLDQSSPGTPGPAYGAHAFRIRHAGHDILIGHVRRVFVSPGDKVTRGQKIARASDAGAPDGCHLHFEVRPAGGGYLSAVRPADYLRLS